MIRFLLRVFGFVLMAAAFAALVVDGTRSIAGGQVLQYPLGETGAWLGGARFAEVMRDWTEAPDGVGRLVALFLAVPGWIAAAVGGGLLLSVGRPHRTGDAVSRHRA